MAEQPAKVRDVAWFELFSWLMLARSVRIALMARVLLLATLGLIATTLGWRAIGAIGWFFPDSAFTEAQPVDNAATSVGTLDESQTNWRAELSRWAWDKSRAFDIAMSARSAYDVFQSAWNWIYEAPVDLWRYFTAPFRGMFSDVNYRVFFFLLLCAIWELLVWGLVGGAITRIAALKFTRDEAPGPVAAVSHAVSKLPSYSLPPLIALGGAAVFAIQLAILGLLMNIGVFAFLAGLAWPFVLMLGLLMAILLLGALVGWPLMWATISVEGTDAFDALSRSYAYTYQRPWRLLWYVLVVAVLAIVSMFVVKLFATTAIALGDWSVDWGARPYTMQEVVRPEEGAVEREIRRDETQSDEAAAAGETATADTTDAPQLIDPNTVDDTAQERGSTESNANATAAADLGLMRNGARRAISFWKWLMEALAAGYQAAFLWVAAVGVYLLLRRDIDGVQTSEVYVDHDAEFGLPPLAEDVTTGVPEVSTSEAARPADVANPANLPRTD
jgi:hypothetical protein